MITQLHYKKLTWIDIENPNVEDIGTLIKDFSIHPHWAEELLKPSERAKTDVDGTAFYAVLHYPDHPSQHHLRDMEIDYIITEHLLVTAHYAPIDTFIEFAKKFEVASSLDRSHITSGAELFVALNNELYRGLREELEPIRKEIKKIESEIFQGNEFTMVKEISNLHRRLLDFKQSIRTHRVILKSFELQAPTLFPHTKINEDIIFRDYFRVENALENSRELLKELRETNDSLLTTKNNDVTMRFTMMAFFTFPLALVATVLLAPDSPAVFHTDHGFWVVVGILVGLLILMYGYFKYKKWM